MSKSHWITVKATKKGKTVDFQPVCQELWDGRKFVFDKNKLNMRRDDHHQLFFVLQDETGLGLRFPSVAHNAMWVRQIADVNSYECPTRDDHDYEVFRPHNVVDKGQKLIAFNSNPDKRKWAFSLNFVEHGKDENDISQYVCWDPIGDNNNGGRSDVSGSVVTYALVGAITGVSSSIATLLVLDATNGIC